MRVAMVTSSERPPKTVFSPTDFAGDSEDELINAAKHGSTAAFENIVERNEARIFRVAQSITRQREDAEDAMQNAFVHAYQNLSQFREDSRFYTWLFRITVNEALMKIRRRRADEVSIDDQIESDDDLIPRELRDWEPNPEQIFSQRQLRGILNDAIGELDPKYRSVFQLRNVEGLSIGETAEALDLTASAVKSRLFRARAKLRNSLDKIFRANKEQSEFAYAGESLRHTLRRPSQTTREPDHF